MTVIAATQTIYVVRAIVVTRRCATTVTAPPENASTNAILTTVNCVMAMATAHRHVIPLLNAAIMVSA